MKFQAERTRTYYERGNAGIPMLHQRGRFAVKVASDVYREILNRVEASNFDVFENRTVVPAARKYWLTVRNMAGPAARHFGPTLSQTTQISSLATLFGLATHYASSLLLEYATDDRSNSRVDHGAHAFALRRGYPSNSRRLGQTFGYDWGACDSWVSVFLRSRFGQIGSCCFGSLVLFAVCFWTGFAGDISFWLPCFLFCSLRDPENKSTDFSSTPRVSDGRRRCCGRRRELRTRTVSGPASTATRRSLSFSATA